VNYDFCSICGKSDKKFTLDGGSIICLQCWSDRKQIIE